LNENLYDLVDRGLLHFDEKNKKFDLHPIMRRYAYERLTAPDRTATHARLWDYFATVNTPAKPQNIDDLAPVIELYHHMVRAGKLDEARDLFRNRLHDSIYYQFGAYQICVELLQVLFLDREDKPPHLKESSAQIWTLAALGNAYSMSGQPRRAVPLFEMHNSLSEKNNSERNFVRGLVNIASMAQIYIGALRSTEANLHRAIELGKERDNQFDEAVIRQQLGRVLSYRGKWHEAEKELDSALSIFEKQKHFAGVGQNWSYRAIKQLLLARENFQLFNFKELVEKLQTRLWRRVNGQNKITSLNLKILAIIGFLARHIASKEI
jgi:tetratricopeptide (TPR) repeat protein